MKDYFSSECEKLNLAFKSLAHLMIELMILLSSTTLLLHILNLLFCDRKVWQSMPEFALQFIDPGDDFSK